MQLSDSPKRPASDALETEKVRGAQTSKKYKKRPDWLKVKLQGSTNTGQVASLIEELNLNTVCLEANCPNRMECYERGTATFMILGRQCTRNCRFCNVTKEQPDPVDAQEPENVAKAIERMKVRHAVITSVTRDDLPDQGAAHFAAVTRAIRQSNPAVTIELLIPDMQGRADLLDIILQSGPDVLNHNVETVPALYSQVRPMADFDRSLQVLRYSKETYPSIQTKSGMMLGLGETQEQVLSALTRLVQEGKCDHLTLGQYLQPSKQHIEVAQYVTPEQFDRYKELALALGFKKVASAPLVRSSYHADELFQE